MDQIILNLCDGLGLQSVIGWFLPIFIGTTNILPSMLTLFRYADKSAEFNKRDSLDLGDDGHDQEVYDFIVGMSHKTVKSKVVIVIWLKIRVT